MNENEGIWKALHATDDRVTALRDDMRDTVTKAVQDAMPSALLTSDEHRWVQLAIKRESQAIAFRQAVIEKSLTALVIMAIGGALLIVGEYLKAHGWKP